MKVVFISLFVFISTKVFSQLPASPDSFRLLMLNQRIDELVAQKQVAAVDSLFADDFVFSHGSGRIEGKAGWLGSVARNRYPVRSHDSVRVQQHGDVAVLRGNMYIERVDKDKIAKYRLRYIRVFALRGSRWQLLSHTTVEEMHL